MASRNIDEPAFHKLVDAIREYIEWKLPIELTEDELTCIDDSVVLMLRDLFTVAPPTS